MHDYDLELARELLDQGAVLLDVRTQAEYDALHVPGAVHVPTGAGARGTGIGVFLPQLLLLVDGDRSRPIVIYCKLGKRAARAKRALEAAGFTNVTNLGGVELAPMRELIARGEPLFRRPPPDLRPILYQFFRDHPFVQSGGPEWNPLAWSMGLRTGGQAEQLAYQALGATLPVPGLGPFQPYRQRALYDFTRGQVQAATGGAAFQPWQGFQDGAPQGFSAGFVLPLAGVALASKGAKTLAVGAKTVGHARTVARVAKGMDARATGFSLGARRRVRHYRAVPVDDPYTPGSGPYRPPPFPYQPGRPPHPGRWR